MVWMCSATSLHPTQESGGFCPEMIEATSCLSCGSTDLIVLRKNKTKKKRCRTCRLLLRPQPCGARLVPEYPRKR